MSEEKREAGLTPKGESLPSKKSTPPRESDIKDNATVRYRSCKNSHLHTIGIAIALFAIIGTIIFCCIAGARGITAGDETTETSSSSQESDENGGELVDLYAFDPSSIPVGHIGFRPLDLSGDASELLNESDHTLDLSALLSRYQNKENDAALSFDLPLVLIVHAHATEGYSPAGAISWDGNGELARSSSTADGVMGVGKILANALNSLGIPTLHSTVLHDTDEGGNTTNSGSFDRMENTIARYLSEYPSIRYVIDLHRDAVLDESGNVIRAVTNVNGSATAQTKIIVGSGEGYDWETNLALALHLTEELNKDGASLCRPPVLKASDFGQEKAAHALLLEIGTAANSQDEAENAARLIAPTLARRIRAVEFSERGA